MEWQTELSEGTIVTFARGSVSEDAQVLFASNQGVQSFLVTDQTPFHPLNLTWPDQPGDRGFLTFADGRRVSVLDSREALLNRANGMLFAGESALGLKRNDPEIHAVVLHVLDGDLGPSEGERILLTVDGACRNALSLQHTAVHLAAFALNRCASPFWTKDAGDFDSLGAPNVDKAAVTHSAIAETGSTDTYRVGKSLRKKGFDVATFLSDLPERAKTINEILRKMLASPAPVLLTPGEGQLGDRRIWSTRLNGADATIPCGGTHVADLSQIAEVFVELTASEDGFVMVTRSNGSTSADRFGPAPTDAP